MTASSAGSKRPPKVDLDMVRREFHEAMDRPRGIPQANEMAKLGGHVEDLISELEHLRSELDATLAALTKQISRAKDAEAALERIRAACGAGIGVEAGAAVRHLLSHLDEAEAALVAINKPYAGGAVAHIEALHQWQRDAIDREEALAHRADKAEKQRDALISLLVPSTVLLEHEAHCATRKDNDCDCDCDFSEAEALQERASKCLRDVLAFGEKRSRR